MPDRVSDALVIGGGPGGLAAATWLARYRRTVVVIDSGEYRNRWVERVHGYLGLDPESPLELLRRARAALEAYPGVAVVKERATGATAAGNLFDVQTERGTLKAARLVLATGVEDAFPDIPGFFEHYGADVFHCSACDGYEARDRTVVAIGWGEHVAGFAADLLEWAARVTVVTEGRTFEGDKRHRAALAEASIDVVEETAAGFAGTRGHLEGVTLASGRELACDLAFFSIEHRPRTDIGKQLGCALTDDGYIEVDERGRTTVQGVYAVGDVTPGDQLVQVAAAKGAVAGVDCARSLSGIARS